MRKEEWNKARMELAAERKGQPKRGHGRQKGGQTEKTAAEQRVETVKWAKYPLLMNPDNLNERYKTKLQQILIRDRRLATAYRLKEDRGSSSSYLSRKSRGNWEVAKEGVVMPDTTVCRATAQDQAAQGRHSCHNLLRDFQRTHGVDK